MEIPQTMFQLDTDSFPEYRFRPFERVWLQFGSVKANDGMGECLGASGIQRGHSPDMSVRLLEQVKETVLVLLEDIKAVELALQFVGL